jgi:hypothetical protein
VSLREFRAGGCTLQLDERSGDLRGLRWHDPALRVIRDDRLGENFRLLIPRRDYEACYFNSRDQIVTELLTNDNGVTCIYDGLRNEGETVDVRVEYRIQWRNGSLEFSIAVDNRTGRPIAEVLFGVLGGLRGVGNRADSRSLVPGAHANLATNLFHTFPAGEYGGGNLGIKYSACAFVYPGYAGLSMPWSEFYNPRMDIGVYYGLHDTETRLSALSMELRPYTVSAVLGSNWPGRGTVPSDEPAGLTVGWMNFPYLREGRVELGPVVFRVHRGDWHEGSAIYRTWFDEHFPLVKPGWLRKEMAWQSTILLNPEDVAVHRFPDLPGMARDARKYDVTAFEICGWDKGGIDRGYPDYRPDPVLGTEQEFRDALRGIRAAGVKPIVFANLQVADTATDEYRDRLQRYVLHGRWAEDAHMLGFGEGTVSARLGLARSNMAILSLAHPELQALLADQMVDLVRAGAAALQLDKTVVVQYLDFNPAAGMSPDRSAPEGLLQTLATILDRGREVDPEFALASEIWWDRTFQFLDVLYSRMVDIDIPDSALVYTFPEVVSTIFAENPGDFNVMSNGMRYGMVWALAPRHYQDSMDERLTRPLSNYVKELIRIRSKHADILFHGRFQDTRGAEVRRHPNLRYSVFRSVEAVGARQACVVVNYGERAVETSVTLEGWLGAVEICQPFEEDRADRLPARLRVAPHSCAVVVELATEHAPAPGSR